MTSSLKIGDKVYVPFWVVLEYFDVTPPDPFIECVVLNLEKATKISPNGSVSYDTCDLELGKSGLIAPEIPSEYVIVPDQLDYWANKIADWIKNHRCSHTVQNTASM
jgi:hypothetical protein